MKAIINAKIVFHDSISEGAILIEDGKIVAVGDIYVPKDAEIIDAKGLYVGPGLIDQHVHGYADLDTRIGIIDDVKGMALMHLKRGTTSITPSPSYKYNKEEFISIIEQCNKAIEEGTTNVIGIHFEGPYRNPIRGASAKVNWDYNDEDANDIFAAAKGNVLHCTYAPEIPGAEKLEAVMQKYGVVGDIGHTNASPDDVYRAVKNGAKIVTHLFDAMGCYRDNPTAVTGDPQDCVSDIVLSIPDLYYELICDSRCLHVTAVSQRQALKNAGEDHIILISDCVASTNAANPLDFPPEDDRSATDLNFVNNELSGSRLTLSVCAKNFKKTTGADIRVVFKCAATNPAKAIGIYDKVGSITAGKDANFVFVDEDFNVKEIYFKGEKVNT